MEKFGAVDNFLNDRFETSRGSLKNGIELGISTVSAKIGLTLCLFEVSPSRMNVRAYKVFD
jgi:hypothetical protein